jgi:hypothetical protein
VFNDRGIEMTDPLLAVPAREVAGKFGFYTDEAMLRPVGIQRHGTTRVVMISLNEYQRLLSRDRQVLLTQELDDDAISAIEAAQASERSKALNHLMDDA